MSGRRPIRLPGELVGFADSPCQTTNGCRGIIEWSAFPLPALQLRFGALFGPFDSRYQIAAVGRLRPARVVFRTQRLKHGLDRMPMVRPIIVSLVQNQPEFETRIGASHSDLVALTEGYSLGEPRVLVPIEHCPDLIRFFERVLSAATAPTESQISGLLYGSRGDGVGNPGTRMGIYRDERAFAGAADRVEIRRLGIPAFTEQDETPSRFTAGAAPPEVRASTGLVSIAACQEQKPGLRREPRRTDPGDNPSRSCLPSESGCR